jgi:hypothetical protein
MALGFRVIGAGLKAAGKVVKAGVKVVVTGVKRAATATIAAIKGLLKSGVTLVSRSGTAIIRGGKLVLKGLERGFSKGIKKAKDLASRLFAKFRFRKFKIVRRGPRIQLFGFINPWVLLADGTIEQVEVKGGRPEIGELVDVVGRKKAGIIVGVVDELPSNTVRELKNLTKAEKKKLYRELIDQSQADIKRSLTGVGETSKHSRELRKSLESAGHTFKGGENAHHIVPSTHPRAQEAQRILKKYGVEINDAHNGLPLSPELHSGLHTNKYIDKVTEMLRGARSKEDVIATLQEIAGLIKANRFP